MDRSLKYPSFNPSVFNRSVTIDENGLKLQSEIANSNIKLPDTPLIVSGMLDADLPLDSATLTAIPEDSPRMIDVQNGCNLAHREDVLISAYDESIATYNTLEGKVSYVSHSLVHMFKNDYYPTNRLNILFCTASNIIHKKCPTSIIANEKWGVDTTLNVAIAKEKGEFIQERCYENSVLLIDGPYLAGDGLAYFTPYVSKIISSNIIPAFIVKNSISRIVVDSTVGLRGQYNSDLHWANATLHIQQRSQFFRYEDVNSHKSKVFCYLCHSKNHSPIRIEFPTEIFDLKRIEVENVVDLIYYLILVQGNLKNPQVRPVAIAEKYARETLKLIKMNEYLVESNLTPTMNEQRDMF